MHLKLTQVVSEITGVTGMAILKAIVAGERDPQRLAKLRNPHCHHDADDIAKALQGTWRAEHLFALRQAVELYDVYHQQIALCDQQIKKHLETFADQSAGQPLPPKARRHKKTNEPRFDARTPLYRMAGVDLTTIEGIEENTALVILSEIGTDMHRWPSVKHFCSWLGLCPQHKISGGKVLSRRVHPGAPRSAGIRPPPLAALVVPVLFERLPCPAMPHVARAQGQVCAQYPTTAHPTPQEGLSNGGNPFQDVPHPCQDTPHPPPERPNLAG